MDAQARHPLIETNGLVKNYGAGAPVLRGVSLSIFAGERVALVGANGAGKSTLLKTLIGLHGVNAGSVSAFDQRFAGLPDRTQRRVIRRQIGFVFQSPSLVGRLCALSNVLHGKFATAGSWRAIHQAIAPQAWRREAAEALDAVGLLHKAHEKANALSGGQAQRVGIARALIRKPRLLIADEPAASLDPVAGHDVMRRLSDLALDAGRTLIFTTHDMDHALTYADRVVALSAGRIILDSPARALTARDLDCVFQ